MNTPTPTVADLINELFRRNPKPNGREYTNQEISAASGIDSSYLSRLRTGKIPNPGRETLKNLSLFFRVPVSYFFPELDGVLPEDGDGQSFGEQLHQVLRKAGLNQQARTQVEGLIALLAQR